MKQTRTLAKSLRDIYIGLSDTEQSSEEAVPGVTEMLTDQFDLSSEVSSSTRFISSLVDTVSRDREMQQL